MTRAPRPRGRFAEPRVRLPETAWLPHRTPPARSPATALTLEEVRMRSKHLIPIAVLAFAAACSDTATSPTSVGRPLFSVSPGTFGNVTTLNAGGTPSGGHIQSGGPVFCVVASDLSITCSGSGSYQIN